MIQIKSEPEHWFIQVPTSEWEDLTERLNALVTTDVVKDSSLYVYSTGILQSKLRGQGFKIKRDYTKTDYIVVDLNKLPKKIYVYSKDLIDGHITFSKACGEKILELEQIVEYCEKNKNPKRIVDLKTIYSEITVYPGDRELFDSLNELFRSHQDSNINMAMEMMSNADWKEDLVYLVELFNRHWNKAMKYSSYRTTTSFKGFLSSLSFNYAYFSYNNPSDYTHYCFKPEHLEFVLDMYKEDLQEKIQQIQSTYNIVLDSTSFKINYNLLSEPKEIFEETPDEFDL
jgi:hypothetical protein